MTLTRRQTLIGAAATVAAAALPAVAMAEKAPDLWHGVKVIKRVVPKTHRSWTRWDGVRPDRLYSNEVFHDDLFDDVLRNVRWRYSEYADGWFFVDKLDWSKPCFDLDS
jgi:hypothetical protein